MKKVRGFADGFFGSYLNGWAIDTDSAGNCFVEVFNSDGERVGSGRAARQRDDLASLCLGRTNLGFSIPVKKLSGPDLLRVLVDGIELPGSPLEVGPGIFDGQFRVSDGVASGSITERCSNPADAPLITIMSQDGEPVGQASAGPASQVDDPFYAPRYFEIPLSNSCYGRSELFLTGLADGRRFFQIETALRLSGHIDFLAADQIQGWLLCPDAPRKKLRLALWANGVFVARCVCNLQRDDLRSLYPESSDAGFYLKRTELDVPRDSLSELSLRLEDSYVDLLGGPFIVGGKIAQIDAAKKIAGIVHRLGSELNVGERSLMQDIVRCFLQSKRTDEGFSGISRLPSSPISYSIRRINILIPIYKGVQETLECIESVLADRSRDIDSVVLVADCPPEPAMMPMLSQFTGLKDVFVLENKQNLGFVSSVNRGLNFCKSGDVLILNSDTKLYKGALDELWSILHSSDDVGTTTALSNNATIFSYPHPQLATKSLDDVSWAELADVAMRSNKGKAVAVPTGHGFCMLVRREVLDRLRQLSEEFGRGYGEENEFCARATDLGYKHVAATAVFVEHLEGVSFGGEKANLIKTNLLKLGTMFPEYTPTIMAYERRDDIRSGRWALDEFRLKKAKAGGTNYVLVVENWQDGGTAKAVTDIEELVGYQGRVKLRLASTEHGLIELESQDLRLRSVFSNNDYADLFALLDAAEIDMVVVHQLLGFDENFISTFGIWVKGRQAIYYVHDFYAACPRVNLIDAVDTYCGVAQENVCARCVKFGGHHRASRLTSIDPKTHRALFRNFMTSMTSIVAPSHDAKRHFVKIFDSFNVSVIPHPEVAIARAAHRRVRRIETIALLGAIGPHKGSKKLLEIASQAMLSHPHLTFCVIGNTDIDEQLNQLPNVTITGRYNKSELTRQIELAQAKIALFLNAWPETFSFTFSEALVHGLVPVVPDIGAPADRAREIGIGVVYPFPVKASEVLETIEVLLHSPQVHEEINVDLDNSRSVAMLQRLFSSSVDKIFVDSGAKVGGCGKSTKRRHVPKRRSRSAR